VEKGVKIELVQRLKEQLKDIDTIFLCNFRGINVDIDTKLRRELRENGSTYLVVKNTLAKWAFEDSDFSQLNPHLVGNTAIAYNQADVVGLAKLLSKFVKEHDKFEFKAGVVEGKVIDLAQLQTLASLPPKEVLVAKLMFMLNYPVQGLVTTLSGVLRNFAVVLDQIRTKKEKE
jgi:large subunit ribosomal protein L10